MKEQPMKKILFTQLAFLLFAFHANVLSMQRTIITKVSRTKQLRTYCTTLPVNKQIFTENKNSTQNNNLPTDDDNTNQEVCILNYKAKYGSNQNTKPFYVWNKE